ncbi:MAG: hypothetical protein WC123_02550 [Bacilli bacterium]|nr:hypothetical protein [Bacilli bacterium]
MANFTGLMLSIVMIFQLILFSIDLISYQIILSKAYSIITYVNAYIVKEGEINDEIEEYVRKSLNAEINIINSDDVSNSNISYDIHFSYEPIFKVIKNFNNEIVIEQKVLLD